MPSSLILAAAVLWLAARDYPEDVRGHSCLMLASPEGRAVHVVCSPKADYLAVITTYVPNPAHWSPEFRKRRP